MGQMSSIISIKELKGTESHDLTSGLASSFPHPPFKLYNWKYNSANQRFNSLTQRHIKLQYCRQCK